MSDALAAQLEQLITKWRSEDGVRDISHADELTALLAALREGHPQDETHEDVGTRVEPLTAGADRQDLPRTGNEPSPSMADAAEMLWIVLANVSDGDWTKQSQNWQDAAARWRDNYFAAVRALSTPPPAGPPAAVTADERTE